MAYKKTSFKRKRRQVKAYKKRKTFRKKSTCSPLKAVRYFKDSFTTVVKILPPLEGKMSYCLVNWQQTSEGAVIQTGPGWDGSLTAFGFDNTARWQTKNYLNWDEYSITGFGWRWMPTLNQAGVAALNNQVNTYNVINGMQVVDDINSNDYFPGDLPNIFTADSSRVLMPSRPARKYIALKGLSKAQNLNWQKTLDYQADLPNGLTEGSTMFYWQGNNMDQSMNIGYMKLTWYITFRGQ